MIPSTLQAPDLPANVHKVDEDALLDIVQRQAARYFWEGAHPVSGLARDRQKTTGAPANDLVAIGGSGFGMLAIIVAVERGWIDRTAALSRLQGMLDFLEARSAITACSRISSMAALVRQFRSDARTTALIWSKPLSCFKV
ncbi:hypothetical protein [Mesorhizobium sp. M0664]|uniref:hypothetical protein n=1 Tax=Mesorhizobium sp. M0664 TaxID=2956982 RepID=UPI003338ECAB